MKEFLFHSMHVSEIRVKQIRVNQGLGAERLEWVGIMTMASKD